MRLVEPKVFFLAETSLDLDGVYDWIKHVCNGDQKMAQEYLDSCEGSDVEQLIQHMAKRCYKSFAAGLNPNVTRVRSDSEEFHANILKQKHGSVMAHGHVTYAFENVSRVFTHEVVRNSVGNDMSQESLRYVRLDDISFWIPGIIAKETEPKMVYDPSESVLDNDEKSLHTPSMIFHRVVETCEWAQKALAEYYDIDNIKDFEVKKKLTSAFRRVAPEGLATGIGMTFNIRSLRWIIEQRTSRAAEEEIRIIFNQVAEHAIKSWPYVLGDFNKIDTGDGLLEYIPVNSKI